MEANHQQPVALGETFSAKQDPVSPPTIQELWTELEGCPVRYLKCGSGPPLVLLHGLLGFSFSWRFNMQILGSVRTVYALDLPGVGYSGRIAEPECNLQTSAKRLLAFMDTCAIKRADLLGNSHGGAVAMMAAALASSRVNRLLLVAPVHPWMRNRRWLITLAASSPGSFLMRRLAPQLATLNGYFLRRMYGDRRRIAPGTLEGYSAPIRIPGTLEHLLAIVRCWKSDLRNLEQRLPELRSIPTLLMWGSRDAAVNPASAEKLRKNFTDCQLEIIPSAGHLPYEELPEEFNRCVLRFLARGEARGL